MFKYLKTHLPKGFIGHKKSTEYVESLYIFTEDGSGLVRLEDDSVKGDFWIMDLSVSVGCREEGLGTILMNIAENIALYNDAKKIRLWVEKDKWMRSWYERLGFKYDGENDELGKITMTKYLVPKA